MAVLLLSCSVAAVNVFVSKDAPLLQFFLYGLLWSLQLIVIALYLPYDSLRRNVQNVLVAFATLAHSAIFLGVQRGGVSSGYMIGLLLVFALILAVLLLREKLAVGVPWLHVLRRADMKKQEAKIVAAAIELERQLTRAVSSPSHAQASREASSVHDAPQHLIISSPAMPPSGEAEEQPGAEVSGDAALGPPPLTLQLDAAYRRELDAQAEQARVPLSPRSLANRPLNSVSPSLHHHVASSQGPGQLFVPRTSSAGPSSVGTDAESPRLSQRSAISGAVQLAPLRSTRTSSVQVDLSDSSSVPPSNSAGTLPPIRLSRALPAPPRMLTPLPMLAAAAPTSDAPPERMMQGAIHSTQLNFHHTPRERSFR